MRKRYLVIIKTSPKNVPRHVELSAAEIIANYYSTDAIFLRPIPMKSPDLGIMGRIFELKSPPGNSKILLAVSKGGEVFDFTRILKYSLE